MVSDNSDNGINNMNHQNMKHKQFIKLICYCILYMDSNISTNKRIYMNTKNKEMTIIFLII